MKVSGVHTFVSELGKFYYRGLFVFCLWHHLFMGKPNLTDSHKSIFDR